MSGGKNGLLGGLGAVIEGSPILHLRGRPLAGLPKDCRLGLGDSFGPNLGDHRWNPAKKVFDIQGKPSVKIGRFPSDDGNCPSKRNKKGQDDKQDQKPLH